MSAWRGLLVATALPMDQHGDVRWDAFASHVAWLAQSGCSGVTPNGSLGEYQTLTDDERTRVVEVAVAAAPPGFAVIPGVAAYGSGTAIRWAETAAKAGADAVMLLPPNAYRASEDEVVAHYRAVASVGLPVVAYNNPVDTRVDLTPPLLARLHGEGLIVGVKEFSNDPRRAYEIGELAPGLDVIAGSDDMALEFFVAGAVGWIAGFANSLPRSSKLLMDLVADGETQAAVALYRRLHPLLRWDSRTTFVQAVKCSMDAVGRSAGPTRPPRGPLSDPERRDIVALTAALSDVERT